jgi:integrase/recombinase XerD
MSHARPTEEIGVSQKTVTDAEGDKRTTIRKILTPHWLGRTVSAALGSGLTTHTLRHRAATTAYAGTHDLRAVQEMLGHSKPETTAQYTAIPDSSIRAAVAAAAA